MKNSWEYLHKMLLKRGLNNR